MNKNKVLIVDDELNVCNFLSEYLEYRGFLPGIALSGVEAIKKIGSEDYDIVLLDLIMPEMNGFEVLEWIIQNKKNLPVIILSGVKDSNVANDALKSGAVDFILKPIDLDQLEKSLLVNTTNLK
jgi:DNA-binding NtrC family response regulator